MSYLTAHQNADRVLIAAEYRRKAMHLLSQDVIGAFWRTASAQKLSGQIKQTILQSEEALADARRAEQASARSPIEVLKYQRQLLDNLKTLEGIRQDLSNARIELANLLNIPLVVDLRVIEPAEEIPLKILSTPLDQLEEIALLQNGDVREQYYNVRIASNEARKGILRLFPSVSFNYGTKYDSDSYLINNQWKEAGLQISFNIFNLLSIGSQNALGDARIALEEQRRITLQMGQLAKVHIARLQYASSIDQFNRADAIWDVDNKISNHMESRARAQTIGSQENISNKTAAVVSLLKRYDALSKLYAASGKLQATLGMEPNIGSVDDLSLNELTNLIKQWFEDWQAAKINLPQSELTKPESSISSEYALDQAK
jgi:hypothetical protein